MPGPPVAGDPGSLPGLRAGEGEAVQKVRQDRKEVPVIKGRVIYVGVEGKRARVGAKSPDGLVWWWTQGLPAPAKGAVVPVPKGAKPEPGKRPGGDPEIERMLRAVALKAAAGLYAGKGKEAERLVIETAEGFLRWLGRPG